MGEKSGEGFWGFVINSIRISNLSNLFILTASKILGFWGFGMNQEFKRLQMEHILKSMMSKLQSNTL
jgi:hypothetical protein